MSATESTEIQLEVAFYSGNYIAGILYGVYLCTSFFSVYFILKSSTMMPRSRLYYLTYTAVLVLVTTLNSLTNPLFGQWMWINHRDVPGGPPAYFAQNISMWLNTLGSAAAITANFMGDALLLYRAYIMCCSKRLVIAFPALLFLGSTAMAILTVISSGAPGASFFQGEPAVISVTWISMTVGLNIILTAMISTRLVLHYNQIKEFLEPTFVKKYAAIMIESAAPFSVLGIAYVVVTIKQNPAQYALPSIWGLFASISPQLIILRVAMGVGWSETVVSRSPDNAGLFSPRNTAQINAERREKDPRLLRASTLDHSYVADSIISEEMSFAVV